MKSILREFALGNISMDGSIKKDSEYARAARKMVDYEEKLKFALNEEHKEMVDNFINAHDEVNLIEANEKFVCGYRLGVLMTMEVFNGIEDVIYGGED